MAWRGDRGADVVKVGDGEVVVVMMVGDIVVVIVGL